MKIIASVKNTGTLHQAAVGSPGSQRCVEVPAKASGQGSAVSGGEFLMLALATCYCNDVYREAARLQIDVRGVEVVASAEFNGVGLAATNVTYQARIQADAPSEMVEQLLKETDAVAEVHNTLRAPIAVTLVAWEEGA